MKETETRFDMSRIPAQWEFFNLESKIQGYGGAMGGGKTRALCEKAFELMLQYPSIRILMARNTHASIEETTKLCMMEDVVPPEAIKSSRSSQSQDWIKLHNDSRCHFIGLEDPVRWFSSEVGALFFDECHEIAEDPVVKLITRLRQRCMDCRKNGLRDCPHFPHTAHFGFNPENPGHWLYKWFLEGATLDQWPSGEFKGYHKDALLTTGAVKPIGRADFIFARATDNPYLPSDYVDKNLATLPELLRRRYLEGEWLYVSGRSYFDVEALTEYATRVVEPKITGVSESEPKVRLRPGNGPWWVWKSPVRIPQPHRYIVSVDVASGTANDFSAIQVVSIEDFEQVAEFQAQLDPTLVALEASRIAKIYNTALVAPEITGGWGFAIVSELERLRYPNIYTRPIFDRLSKKWTDALGWDTTLKSRAVMLETLERVLREREFVLNSPRCLTELSSFVWPEQRHGDGPYKGVPQAQPGSNDDLVMALAIAVTLAVQRPRQLRTVVQEFETRPAELVTGL